MKNQTTKRSIGAAHLGPGSGAMFGRRGPLLAPEDSGSAAAAPSAEAATTIAQDTTGTAPVVSSEKMLPQSQVNVLIASAKRDAREAALREQQTGAQPPKKDVRTLSVRKGDSGDRLAALEAELAETKQRSVFDKHAARLGLSDDAAEDLFTLSKSQKPTDVGEWLEAKAARFGIKPAPSSTQPTQTTHAAPGVDPVKPPAAAPAAPIKVDPLTSAGVVDIFNLSEAQLHQLGPAGLRSAYEAILKLGQQQRGAPPRPKTAQRT